MDIAPKRTSSRRPKRLLTQATQVVALVLLASAGGACEEGYAPETDPCPYVEAPPTCQPDQCCYDLRLDGGCGADVEYAEVLIDGHLEAAVLLPGQEMVPCMRTPLGLTSSLVVRGGGWLWNVEQGCPEPTGTTHTLVFECQAVQ